MSVIRNERDEFWTFAKESVDCFFCGERITFPHVFWRGCGASAHLHPACAVEFVIRLNVDLRELEHHVNGSFRFTLDGGV